MKILNCFKYSGFFYNGEVISVFDDFLKCQRGFMEITGETQKRERFRYEFDMYGGEPSIRIANSLSYPFGSKAALKMTLNDLVGLLILPTVKIEMEVLE